MNDAVPVDVAITEPIAAISNISPAMAWELEVLLGGGEGASLTVHAENVIFFLRSFKFGSRRTITGM